MVPATVKAIYTDGACSGNPGPGGWGTVIYFTDGSIHEMGGSVANTTNNRMEMQAAIAALQFLATAHQDEPVPLYTDSEYVKNGVTQWLKGWKAKGWKTSTGKAVLNQDLWQSLDCLNSNHVVWKYVRGHAGNEGNERCDAIARAFSRGGVPALTQVASLEPSVQAQANAAQPPTNLLPQTSTVASVPIVPTPELTMVDPTTPALVEASSDDLPREVRVAQLRNLVETLHMADEIAGKGYLISSSELADLMDVNASAVTSRGDNWVWRNWVVSRVRREGNQILWQLERVD